jgi:hypothetical protein
MGNASKWAGVLILLGAGAAPLCAAKTELLKNDKVAVSETTLAPGEQETVAGKHASVLVYLDGGKVEIKFPDGPVIPMDVARGRTTNERAQAETLTNAGRTALRMVRVEFLGEGGGETWGMTGLPPNYKLIFENRHSRTYDISIVPHGWEPQHTHHARVVVCLSGAQLEHVLPDGSKQNSTLKTDEVAWREGQTHKGHNLGDTKLWVIAIEPK